MEATNSTTFQIFLIVIDTVYSVSPINFIFFCATILVLKMALKFVSQETLKDYCIGLYNSRQHVKPDISYRKITFEKLLSIFPCQEYCTATKSAYLCTHLSHFNF